jgi:hypothetical protein
MSGFSEDINRILNSPRNLIRNKVFEFISTEKYQAYAQTVFPFDRLVHIYRHNYQVLTNYFGSINESSFLHDNAIDRRNEVLMNGMVHIHNYLSVQYSLLQILKLDAAKSPLKLKLQAQFSELRKAKVSKFIGDWRNIIIHETNFSTSLRFDSKTGDSIKIVYQVAEIRLSRKWKNSLSYISKFNEFVMIEDVVKDYNNQMIAFLSRYEIVMYNGNAEVFKEVLTTLLNFSDQYNSIGERDFLPVSEDYIKSKLKLFQN